MSKIVRRAALDAGHARDLGGDCGRALVLDPTTFPHGAQPGDLVLTAQPFAKVLQPELWQSHCHHCFTAAATAKLSRCGRCRAVYYCSRDCQQKDWKPDHQSECRRLEQLLSLRLRGPQIADVLLLGRVMRRRSAPSTPMSETAVSPSELVWHAAHLNQESLLLAALAQKLQLVDPSLPVRELQTMLSRFESNNFSICDDLLLELGVGCYPLGAMANHSCDPNCAVTFNAEDRRAEFRAMRAIAPDEELTQSYVDAVHPRRERQQQLAHKYQFQCACARCALPVADPASRDTFSDADADGAPEAQWSEVRVREVAHARALLLETLQQEAPDVRTREHALATLRKALHPANTSLLQVYAALFSAEMERGSVGAAIPFGEAMLAFYERVYPAKHPLVGLHLFTLGDLYSQQPEQHGDRESSKQQALVYLRRAKSILQVTHGKHHRFVALLDDRIRSS